MNNLVRQFLRESSLGRIKQHIESGQKFAMLSAEHWTRSEKENAEYTAELKKYLRDKGYGFIPTTGRYTYGEDGNKEQSVEDSVMILNIDFDDALMLGAAYNQESIIYHDENRFGLYYTNFGTEDYASLKKELTEEEFLNELENYDSLVDDEMPKDRDLGKQDLAFSRKFGLNKSTNTPTGIPDGSLLHKGTGNSKKQFQFEVE